MKKIALAALGIPAAALMGFAPIVIAPPAQAVPCATPDGSVTQACNDCLHASAEAKDPPATTAQKCGYPGTVASPDQKAPQGQKP